MNKKVDLVLIQPPSPLLENSKLPYWKRVYFDLRSVNLYPPLGLSCLAEFLKNVAPSFKTAILDGEILGLEEIKNRLTILRPSCVGISPTFLTYELTLELCRFSKNLGAKTILGGHYATGAGREILLNRARILKTIALMPYANRMARNVWSILYAAGLLKKSTI